MSGTPKSGMSKSGRSRVTSLASAGSGWTAPRRTKSASEPKATLDGESRVLGRSWSPGGKSEVTDATSTRPPSTSVDATTVSMRRRAHPRPWLVHCDCALGARRSKWGPLLPLLVRTVARLAEEKTDAGPTPRLAIAIVHERAFKHRCARGTERGGPSTDWVLAPTVLTQRPCPMKIGRRDCHLLAAWLSMLPKLANNITWLYEYYLYTCP